MTIVVLEPLGLDQHQLRQLAANYLPENVNITYHLSRTEDPIALVERVMHAEIIMLSNIPFTRNMLEQCPNLRMISVAFTGVDHLDLEYCNERGIVVSNASGYATTGVAELVFGLVLGLARNIPPCDQRTRELGTKEGLIGWELSGKTFGIVGAGAIGLETARLAKAFGCNVLLYNGERSVTLEGMESVTLETLLKESDVVSLHTPLTEDTRGLIGKRELELMKPTSLLINTSRGPVVDSHALAQALKDGTIAGAGIDVFDTEPPLPADDILLTSPHTLLTPHVAFATKESMVKRGHISFNNVKQYLAGTPQNVMR